MLIKVIRLKNCFVDTMIYYNMQYSPFIFCVWPSQHSVDVCYIDRIWPNRIWLFILLVSRRVRDHSMWILLFPDTYPHAYLKCDIYFQLLLYLWTNGFRLTGNRRLFTSILILLQFRYKYSEYIVQLYM